MSLKVYVCSMGGNIETADFLRPIIAELGMTLVTISEWPTHDVLWRKDTWLKELSKADIVVCPQRRPMVQPAKSANRATQAMALGKPVVASMLQAYTEAIVHGVTGFLCDGPEEWKTALEKLRDNPTLREEMGARAKDAVGREYSPDAVGARWRQMLSSLADANCAPPKVDIIIPTWNNLPYLKACIDSIRAATDWPHNMIVVSSGTDCTADWIRAQPDVIYHISDRRLHFSEANNIGIEIGREDYVMFLNDDTIVGKGWLSALMHEAMKPGVGAVGPFSNCDQGWMHHEKISAGGRPLIPGMTLDQVAKIIPDIQSYRHDKVVHLRKWIAFYATLIPRSVIQKVGRLDTGFKSGDEDLDYCKRIRDHGYRILQTFDSWVFHFGGATRKASERADHVLHHVEDQENHKYFVQKWGMQPSDPEFRNDLPISAPALPPLSIPLRGAEPVSPLFVMYTGHAFEGWTPKSVDEGGIGGSETATIYTALDFIRKGWRAKVYGDCRGKEGVYDGVEYLHHDRWESMIRKDNPDLFVSSRRPDVFGHCFEAGKKVCLAHDIWLSSDKDADLHVNDVDRYFVLSPWHKAFFMSHHRSVPEEKIHVTRDGVDLSRFKDQLPRVKGRMIYSSSPDRGLKTLLDCLPEIRKEVPHAEVHVFYGFYNWEESAKMRGDIQLLLHIQALKLRLKEPGVVYRGRMGQKDLAKEMIQAELCGFPSWFSETFYIGGVELMAAGVPIVATDLAAIQTTVGKAGILIPGNPDSREYREQFIEECISLLTVQTHWEHHHKAGIEKAKAYDWKGIADEWALALGLADKGVGSKREVLEYQQPMS